METDRSRTTEEQVASSGDSAQDSALIGQPSYHTERLREGQININNLRTACLLSNHQTLTNKRSCPSTLLSFSRCVLFVLGMDVNAHGSR